MVSFISTFIALSDGSISLRSFEVTFSSTLLISFFICLNFSLGVSSFSLLFVSRLSTFEVSSSILLLLPLTSVFNSAMSAIIFFSILVIESSTVSTGVFFVFRLNLDFSLFVSFKFLWLLYLLASWSNLDVVSLTLIAPFGDGGFFLFLGFVSSFGGSCSILLSERLIFSLYLVT